MSVETLGEALRGGWRLKVRCAHGRRDGLKSIRECRSEADLDLASVVWTRGPNFPVARLGERMMCPACGSRRVAVIFVPPAPGGRQAGEARIEPDQRRRDLDRMQFTVEQWSGGTLDRLLAASSDSDIAHAAFLSAVKEVQLRDGDTIELKQVARLIAQHPPREPSVRDLSPEQSNAEYDRRREGLPKGRKRVWK